MAKQNDSPMMKQFRDLKAKHPDVLLLFRCGDFYETYEDDARECAKVLGITLTILQSDNMPMAGFPYHALDTYLPKLIRTGRRVAICDQLDPPPGPRRKRGETIDNNSSTNQNNSEAMKQNYQVTDLIGKSVCSGNAKYVIKSVDGDKVKVDFAMGDNAAKEMTMKAEQIEKLLQGGWTVGEGTAQEPAAKQEAPKTDEPTAKTVKMEPEPKPKQEQPAKPKVTLRKKQPQAKAETKTGKLTYSTYTNAKGKTCAKVSGFAETDAAYQKDAAASLHGSATYENTKQGRVNFLLFGPRYAEVAKTVCQMLNEGKTVADCQAVVDRATEERAQKREEWKQKREAYRQEREGKAQTAKPQGEKLYTAKEIADLLERVMRETPDPEAMAELNAIKAKAA